MDNIKQRLQLIDMISRKEEQRYRYHPTLLIYSSKDPIIDTWEKYDKVADNFISFGDDSCLGDWINKDEAWLLTPEQANQLGDVRDYHILLNSNYYDLLWEWGLVKKFGVSKKHG